MTYEFRTQRTVEFHETDLAGIVHFSNYFRYMEAAEHAFFRSLAVSVHASGDNGMIGFARVHASCDYRRPLHYPEEFEIRVLVTEINEKSIRYQFRFMARDEEIARGEIQTVCVSRSQHDDRMRAVPIPEGIRSKLSIAPAEVLTD